VAHVGKRKPGSPASQAENRTAVTKYPARVFPLRVFDGETCPDTLGTVLETFETATRVSPPAFRPVLCGGRRGRYQVVL